MCEVEAVETWNKIGQLFELNGDVRDEKRGQTSRVAQRQHYIHTPLQPSVTRCADCVDASGTSHSGLASGSGVGGGGNSSLSLLDRCPRR